MPRHLNPAERRYVRRLLPAMAAYVVVLAGVSFWFRSARPPAGALLYAAALAPALPLVAVLWVLGRYIVEETDEYLRLQVVRSVLWGTGLTLAVATVWGFLETFAGLAHAPAYAAFILFFAGFGLAQGVQKLREGSAR